ncbi:hypothetical protein ARTHRO9AX_220215 [Arthrobacter sp. 9AX]|nr:hypothetical protein ARTHRO9AX_220215 [Arthrobacter sp. 9AX]
MTGGVGLPARLRIALRHYHQLHRNRPSPTTCWPANWMYSLIVGPFRRLHLRPIREAIRSGHDHAVPSVCLSPVDDDFWLLSLVVTGLSSAAVVGAWLPGEAGMALVAGRPQGGRPQTRRVIPPVEPGVNRRGRTKR